MNYADVKDCHSTRSDMFDMFDMFDMSDMFCSDMFEEVEVLID